MPILNKGSRIIKFTHNIIVPKNEAKLDGVDGYIDEIDDVIVFPLSQEEYDDLRRKGGLFDLIDSTFGTIIDDCEEDRLSISQVIQAIEIVKHFPKSEVSIESGFEKVLMSLEYAKRLGVFWEIVNGVELCK